MEILSKEDLSKVTGGRINKKNHHRFFPPIYLKKHENQTINIIKEDGKTTIIIVDDKNVVTINKGNEIIKIVV